MLRWNLIFIAISISLSNLVASELSTRHGTGDILKNHENFYRSLSLLTSNSDESNNPNTSESAYIICIGQSGSGIRATINQLFPLSESEDVSPDIFVPEIIEYSMRVPVQSLDINNTKTLRVIEVPGLLPNSNEEHDLIILTNLILQLRSDEEYRSNPPTAVLLFSRFNDSGSSTFLNLLKTLNDVREIFLPNDSSSNIVFVLTNFLYETKELTQNPLPRLNEFRNAIKRNTEFSEPIKFCVVENDGQKYDLSKVGDNFQLPNNELYPDNLVLAVEAISSDSISKSVFANRKTTNVTINKFKILDKNDSNVLETLEVLKCIEDGSIGEASEVSTALNDAYNRMDYSFKRPYPGSLQFLQKEFQNTQITEISQIPVTASEIVTFLRGKYMNPVMVQLFQDAFSVEISEMSVNQLVGYGYDILEDSPVENTPFVFTNLKFSELGFMIHEDITGRLLDEEVKILHFLNDADSYKSSRLSTLNAPNETDVEEFLGEVLPGYNIIKTKGKSRSMTVTMAREIRKFLLTMNNGVKFDKDFLNLLQNIPKFNLSCEDSVQKWTHLFHTYGTHIVTSAYGGGQTISTMTIRNSDLKAYKNGNVEKITSALEQTIDFKNSTDNFVDNSVNIRLIGGDQNAKEINLQGNLVTNISEAIQKWKHTLIYKPVMLQTNIKLLPLSDIFKRVNISIAREMEKAMMSLVQGTLEFVPPPAKPKTLDLNSERENRNLLNNTTSYIDAKLEEEKRQNEEMLRRVLVKLAIKSTTPPTPTTVLTEESQEGIDESQLEIMRSLNKTFTELMASVAVERKALEEAEKRFRDMMTTIPTTRTPRPRPTYTSPNPTVAPTAPPTDREIMMSRGADYLLGCIGAVSQGSSKLREKLLRMYQQLVGNRMTDEELRLENLRRVVDAAKQEDEQPISQPETTATVLSNIRGVGYGYDLIHERSLRKTPFQLNGDSYTRTKMTNSHVRTSYVINVFSDVQGYINYRARTTNSNIYFKSKEFKGTLIPGHTTSNRPDTIVKEYKEWHVTLNKPILPFSSEFRADINTLRPYLPNDCDSVKKWRRHFNEYGTHVITSAYIGGAIEFSPYGTFVTEVRSRRLRDMPYFFDTVRLEDKQVMCRAIGGDTTIISNESLIGHRHINEWAATIESNSVLLPTDIKLIPIYRLISQARSNFYHNYLKAFNAYLDGSFDVCGNGIDCGVSGPNNCSCPPGQKLIKGHCETLEGSQCSVDTWDDCAPNSVCVKLNDNHGFCQCRNDFENNAEKLCFKPYGKTCFDSTQCAADEGLGCFSETCKCAQTSSTYDYSKRACLGRLGDKCGVHYWFGLRLNFVCDDEFNCHPESETCT